MLLKSAVVPFWTLGWPAAKTWYTLPVGSATIGPAVLLNVASPVTLPWPGIGLATCVHVWPSSVERHRVARPEVDRRLAVAALAGRRGRVPGRKRRRSTKNLIRERGRRRRGGRDHEEGRAGGEGRGNRESEHFTSPLVE